MTAVAGGVSLLLPTRGRARLAERFIRSAAETAERPKSVEIVLCVDQDDPESHALDTAGLDTVAIVGARATMGTYNMACLAQSKGDIVVLVNDDIIVRTRGWDRRLREVHAHYPDGVYMAYPNDLYKGRRLCAFPILSRRTCELLGEPFPRAYRGAFIDYHLLDIFKRLEHVGQQRLIYLEDVVFEHMHFRTGKSEYDETYRSRGRFDDDETFLALRGDRSLAAGQLLGAMGLASHVRSGHVEDKAREARLRGARPGLLEGVLADDELPISWRAKLTLWFLGRRIAGALGIR
jgi:hypothetical protein